MYYGWVNGFYGHHSARSASHDARNANQAAQRAESAMTQMRDALERQALLIRSLLTICERKGVFTEQEFREVMNEIDLSDGRLDGRFKDRPKPRECPECGKVNGKSAVSCMYCEALLPERKIM